ncbi:MAG: 16S rRNA (uracil(1498)-N(3))-methyltransferase [Clostridia bacterium]|nr:16S rRNA (uracil(1498)-N(3))-methyltransferase [Clostridia bacterium]
MEGDDAQHIRKSLRMKEGEELTLVSPDGTEHSCVIEGFSEGVEVKVVSSKPCQQEPTVKVTLYQGLTKGDKMDFIVQKAVELGVTEIVPTLTDRCISRPDEKSIKKKCERWQKIALGAAQQSRRGKTPEVKSLLTLKEAAEKAKYDDVSIVFYEGGGKTIASLLKDNPKTVSIFIGSEGGFEESEIKYLLSKGVTNATLGKRILRAETAPLAALSAIMFFTGNMN